MIDYLTVGVDVSLLNTNCGILHFNPPGGGSPSSGEDITQLVRNVYFRRLLGSRGPEKSHALHVPSWDPDNRRKVQKELHQTAPHVEQSNNMSIRPFEASASSYALKGR